MAFALADLFFGNPGQTRQSLGDDSNERLLIAHASTVKYRKSRATADSALGIAVESSKGKDRYFLLPPDELSQIPVRCTLDSCDLRDGDNLCY